MLEAAVRMRSAAVVCAEAPVRSLSDPEVGATLTAVHLAEQAMVAAKLHLVRELDARGGATGGAAAWLGEHLRLSASSARRLVVLARAVDQRPCVDAALIAGAMDAEQAGTVTTALAELPAEVGLEVLTKAETMLVGWAGEFAAPALRRLGERVLAHVAPEVAEQAEARLLAREEQRAHAARTVSLRSIGAGRYRLTGVLDAEAAAIMTAALDPLCNPRSTRAVSRADTAGPVVAGRPDAAGPMVAGRPDAAGPMVAGRPDTAGPVAASGGVEPIPASGPSGADPAAASAVSAGVEPILCAAGSGVDERSPGQRRADALIDVCRLALAGGGLPANGGDRPQLTVTVGFDALSGGLGTATVDTGDRLSAAQVRRLACDAQLIPAVLDGAGQVLDLGHARRLITGPLRRALALRDRGCAFPGCDRPARWCEGHHIRSWVDGGPTSLDNAVLLCGRHHRAVHHGDWTVRLATDGLPEFVPPAHLDPHRRPRRNIFHDRR